LLFPRKAVGRAPEQEDLRARLLHAGAARAVLVVSDGRAALEGAFGGGAGIVLIAGTGSIVMGRGPDGRALRAGGWGPVLGDEGSAYALVLAGIRAVLEARDGWGERTALAASLLAGLGLRDWDEVVGAVSSGRLDRERIAAACPRLFAAAREGDGVAARILADGAGYLGRQAAAVARRLGLGPPVPVACTGGVFAEAEALWPHLAATARDAGVQLVRQPARLPALFGALLLAAGQVGLSVPAAALAGWVVAEPGAILTSGSSALLSPI
jgi:N-acetylglucosamine kinase-like BadF-type ATPase